MFSIITPVHPISLPFLGDCCASLKEQTHNDFEWVVLGNGGVTANDVLPIISDIDVDKKVNVRYLQGEDHNGHGLIGALKGECCKQAHGTVIVELDADDMLFPRAIEVLAHTFSDEKRVFAYSDSMQFQHSTWKPHIYSSYWGWDSYACLFPDPSDNTAHSGIAMKCFPPDVNTMRRIEWAPNHVRAWRASAYTKVGGHNTTLKTGDDHELVCRFYKEYGPQGFAQINQPLYAYRVHGKNSCVTDNNDVQKQVGENYNAFYEPMALRWARQMGLRCLDLGGRFNSPVFGDLKYESVDKHLPADVLCDLEKMWPLEDSSVGVLRGYHVLEHLADSIHAMNEAYRVLAPGGVFFIEVPSVDGKGAFRDPTHRSYWNDQSFWYYTNSAYARFIRPDYKGRFQLSCVQEHRWKDGVVVVRAELICLKEGYKTGGDVLI